MTAYHYEQWEYDEIDRCVRGMLPAGMALRRASRDEDLGGVDLHYVVNHHVDLQVRVRRDRPAWAPDADITFRTTEPRMMAANTYAPLAVFFWFRRHHVVAGKVIDVYRMYERLNPPFRDRVVHPNSDGTGFYDVSIAELHTSGALLKIFDGTVWATVTLGGAVRLNRILLDSVPVHHGV